MKRWIIGIGLAALVVVVGLRVGLSFLINGQIQSIAEAQGSDPEVTFDRVESTERPTWTRRQFHGVTVRRSSGLQANAELIDVTIPALDVRRAEWRADGMVRVEEPGQWIATSQDIEGETLVNLAGRLQEATMQAPTLRLDGPTADQGITVSEIAANFRWDSETRLVVSAETISAGDFELQLEDFSLGLAALPALPQTQSESAMAAWRDGGGTANIEVLSMRMGPSTGRIQGQFVLDENLQPSGEGTVQVTAPEAFLDYLIERGFIGQDQAVIVKLTVSVMASADNDGDPNALTMPLRLEQNELFVGEFMIARLNPLVWAPE
ncbi:MAG: DUF2125 domain-containing protein [Pseudomonadota bacterium]